MWCFASLHLALVLRQRCNGIHFVFVFLMIRRPPRSTLDRSSAASDVYKRQNATLADAAILVDLHEYNDTNKIVAKLNETLEILDLSLIHISEPTRPY
mgnify:CR=1 FL=1